MGVRDLVKRALGAARAAGRKKSLRDLRQEALESAISVMDDLVSTIAGHSVRTRPVSAEVHDAESKEEESVRAGPTGFEAPGPSTDEGRTAVPQTETSVLPPDLEPSSENASEPGVRFVPGRVEDPEGPAPAGPEREIPAAPSAESERAPSAESERAPTAETRMASPTAASAVPSGSLASSSGAPPAVPSTAPSAVPSGSLASSPGAPPVVPSASPSAVPSGSPASSPGSSTSLPGLPASSSGESPADLILLVRDPDWLFAYWDPSLGSGDGALKLVDEQGTATLQLVNVTAGYAFMQAPAAGRTYRASLLDTAEGRAVLAVSAPVHVPEPVVSVAAVAPRAVAVGPKLRAVPPPAERASLPSLRGDAPGASFAIGAVPDPAEIAPSSWVLGMMPTSPGAFGL